MGKELPNIGELYTIQLINPWSLIKVKRDKNNLWNLKYNQFLKNFNNIVIIKQFPKNWRGYRID